MLPPRARRSTGARTHRGASETAPAARWRACAAPGSKAWCLRSGARARPLHAPAAQTEPPAAAPVSLTAPRPAAGSRCGTTISGGPCAAILLLGEAPASPTRRLGSCAGPWGYRAGSLCSASEDGTAGRDTFGPGCRGCGAAGRKVGWVLVDIDAGGTWRLASTGMTWGCAAARRRNLRQSERCVMPACSRHLAHQGKNLYWC